SRDFTDAPVVRTARKAASARDTSPVAYSMPGFAVRSRLTSLLQAGHRPFRSILLLALRLQHRAGAVLRAAAAFPDLLQPRGVLLVQGDAVVVGQFLAGLDLAGRLDEHAVLATVLAVMLLKHRLAVGLAAVVDPARDPALVVGVDH